MAIIKKDFPTLNADTIARLVALGYTDAQFGGTPIRNITDAIDLHLSNAYTDMEGNIDNVYISQCSDDGADALGLLVGKTRMAGETLASFKSRIMAAEQSNDSANTIALQSALTGISGISSVVAVPYTQGVGSLTFYLIVNGGIASASQQALAQSTVNSMVSAGGYILIDVPTPIYLNIQASVSLSSTVNSSNTTGLGVAAGTNYINGLSMGATFVVSELENAILNSSTIITDIDIQTISTSDSNGVITQQLVRNLTPDFDQQFLAGTITIL